MHDRVEIADLSKPEHYKIALDAIKKNINLLDDSINLENYISDIAYYLNNGSFGFFYYIQDKIYAAIYVYMDRYNNATLNFTTFENSFYKTAKVIRFLVQHLFEKKKVNKIKADLYLFQHLAEVAYRYAGLKKEGILKGELRLKNRPVDLLVLGITQKDYQNLKVMSKKELNNIIKRVKR